VVELSTLEIFWRLALAAVLGGAVGMERELREREAGLRTHLLVSVGAALFTLVSAYAWSDFTFSRVNGITFDPTRIAAQIVTGVGFLGAGAIIRQGLSVRGLTTAATLWLVAAIGMASGAGYWRAAVIATIGAIVTLWPLRIVTHQLVLRLRPEHEQRLVVELEGREGVAPVLSALEELRGRVSQFELNDTREGRELALTVEFPQSIAQSAVAGRLGRLPNVRAVRWPED
jgi:putative Mg2+ transporter-C (MgtC) family protein